MVFIRLSNYLEPTDHNNTLESITRIPEAGLPSSSGWLLIAVLITHNHPTKPSSSKLSRQSDLKKEKETKKKKTISANVMLNMKLKHENKNSEHSHKSSKKRDPS